MWQFNFLLNNLHEKFDETFLNCAHAQHRMDFLRNLTLLLSFESWSISILLHSAKHKFTQRSSVPRCFLCFALLTTENPNFENYMNTKVSRFLKRRNKYVNKSQMGLTLHNLI